MSVTLAPLCKRKRVPLQMQVNCDMLFEDYLMSLKKDSFFHICLNNNMKHIILLLPFFFFQAQAQSQSLNTHSKTVRISGKIENLPNGRIYLVAIPDRKRILDSTISKNGSFLFSFVPKSQDLYSSVSIIQKDDQVIERDFSFITNKLFNGKPDFLDYFLLEDGLKINGSFKEFKPKDFKLPEKLKILELNTPLTGGKQTWVLYNISPKFPNSSSDLRSFTHLQDLIQKYPYSFYLLSELESNCSTLTAHQLNNLLSLFNDNLKSSQEWIKLKKLTASYAIDKGNILEFNNLITADNKRAYLIEKNSKYRYILLVFWASWCKPCLEEIPRLKELYNSNKSSDKLAMISVSLDQTLSEWTLMLQKQKMPWRQLIVANDQQKKALLFELKINGEIPALVLLDKSGKVLKKTIGFDSNSDLGDFIKSNTP